jgi:hypothetical protein
MGRDKTLMALAVVVLLHLGPTLAHGSAHGSARVELPPAGLAFVLLVVVIGPLAGLAWAVRDPRAGARLVGAAMAASLLFGLINHFLIPGADHVAHVVGPSRALFGVTAVLLAISEAAGAALGLARGFRPARRPA